jgi:ribosomal protein S18 acetylase RimI-like enzyme
MKPRADDSARRDANTARIEAFLSGLIQSKNVHFNSVYGENQLSLMLLGTRPEYQQLGAGTALVEWGMQKASEQGLALTLFSSRQALGLYRRLGFVEIANCHVQVDGEEECLDIPMLVLRPREEDKVKFAAP